MFALHARKKEGEDITTLKERRKKPDIGQARLIARPGLM